MIRQKKLFILKIFIGISIAFMVNVNAFTLIYHNGSGTGYEGGDGGKSADGYNGPIETYIIEGAGYFISAHSDVQDLLNRVESRDLEGIDYPGLQQLAASALENITNAVKTYEQLINTAEATPYNQYIIDKLKSFDYDSYRNEYNLNQAVFEKLAAYLSRGDITGTFKHAYFYKKNIEALLIFIKNEVDANRLPVLPVVWRLNELCAEAALFGSFSARVFHTIQ